MSVFTTFLANIALCLFLINKANAECANACNGHGKCTAYDMCICNRNWQANDCSERVCQFGLAHVDTAKGDLNMDGTVSNPFSAANTVAVTSPNSFVYPYGTAEKFPAMANSDGVTLKQTAHYYMECSNKGVCDRTKGECQCLDGYEGVSCQRASCPGTPTCSGHGTCQSIKQLASKTSSNVYNLWDKDSTMGCLCDSGYSGPDCSERQCKHGVDPLYLDDTSTIKYSEYNFATLLAVADGGAVPNDPMNSIFTNGLSQYSNGEWAIRFYDANGEDWLTDPIKAYATCDDVLNALYALPNNAIPLNSVYCEAIAKTTLSAAGTDFIIDTSGSGALWQNVPGGSTSSSRDGINKVGVGSKLAFWEMGDVKASLLALLLQGEINGLLPSYAAAADKLPSSASPSDTTATTSVKLLGAIYNLRFLGNPGKLKQPEIEIYLDGKRPSLVPGVTNSKVLTKVWTDGQQGESIDYFADYCNIQVSIDTNYKLTKIDGTIISAGTAAELAGLKSCLGTSDFNDYNNIEVYNWDRGNKYFPHLIKLVKSPTIYTDGGYYAAVYFDGTNFKLLNPFQCPGCTTSTIYDVYTTKGTLALVSENSEASFGFGSKYIFTQNTAFDPAVAANRYSGDLSCDLYTGIEAEYETEGSGLEYNLAKESNIFPTYTSNNADVACTTTSTPWVCANIDTAVATSATLGIPYYQVKALGTLNDKTYRYWQGAMNSYCLNRGDNIVLLNFANPASNSPYLNIYTVDNVKTVPSSATITDKPNINMRHIITTDIATNWAHMFGQDATQIGGVAIDKFLVYKFIPAKASSYNYVGECSNRGTCNRDTGVCECFPGYSSDNCHTQSSLAL